MFSSTSTSFNILRKDIRPHRSSYPDLIPTAVQGLTRNEVPVASTRCTGTKRVLGRTEITKAKDYFSKWLSRKRHYRNWAKTQNDLKIVLAGDWRGLLSADDGLPIFIFTHAFTVFVPVRFSFCKITTRFFLRGQRPVG